MKFSIMSLSIVAKYRYSEKNIQFMLNVLMLNAIILKCRYAACSGATESNPTFMCRCKIIKMLTCGSYSHNLFYHVRQMTVLPVGMEYIGECHMRNSHVVSARNITAVKTDWSWETSLARFLILLINDNQSKCCPSCLF